MLKRLLSDVRFHLVEAYEELKFRFLLPEVPVPLAAEDVPGLAARIHTLEQQHALAKEARRILRQR
jgi:hypothetical protein